MTLSADEARAMVIEDFSIRLAELGVDGDDLVGLLERIAYAWDDAFELGRALPFRPERDGVDR